MGKPKRRYSHRKTSAWSQSAEFREIGRAAITAFNKRRHLRKKCGAKTRGTGDPCQNIAKENGRCHLHGGRTPKGDEWHVRQLPTSKTKTALRKFERKIEKASRQERARRLWLKRASEQERAAYDQWLWAHPKGNAAARATRRLNRRLAEEQRHLLAENRKRPLSPEVQSIADRIAEIRAYQAWVKLCQSGVFA